MTVRGEFDYELGTVWIDPHSKGCRTDKGLDIVDVVGVNSNECIQRNVQRFQQFEPDLLAALLWAGNVVRQRCQPGIHS